MPGERKASPGRCRAPPGMPDAGVVGLTGMGPEYLTQGSRTGRAGYRNRLPPRQAAQRRGKMGQPVWDPPAEHLPGDFAVERCSCTFRWRCVSTDTVL